MGGNAGAGKLGGTRGRWWWGSVAVLLAVAGGFAGRNSGRVIEPIYQATSTLLVGDVVNSPTITDSDIETSTLLVPTYSALIRSQGVLESVTQDLDLEVSWRELKDDVHAFAGPNETPLVTVSVLASSPSQARSIASAIVEHIVALSKGSTGDPETDEARAFASTQAAHLQDAIVEKERRILELEGRLSSARTSKMKATIRSRIRSGTELIIEWQRNYRTLAPLLSSGVSSNSLRVVGPAEASTTPLRPDALVNTALGVAAGALSGLGIAFAFRLRGRRRGADPPQSSNYGHAFDPWVQELAD